MNNIPTCVQHCTPACTCGDVCQDPNACVTPICNPLCELPNICQSGICDLPYITFKGNSSGSIIKIYESDLQNIVWNKFLINDSGVDSKVTKFTPLDQQSQLSFIRADNPDVQAGKSIFQNWQGNGPFIPDPTLRLTIGDTTVSARDWNWLPSNNIITGSSGREFQIFREFADTPVQTNSLNWTKYADGLGGLYYQYNLFGADRKDMHFAMVCDTEIPNQKPPVGGWEVFTSVCTSHIIVNATNNYFNVKVNNNGRDYTIPIGVYLSPGELIETLTHLTRNDWVLWSIDSNFRITVGTLGPTTWSGNQEVQNLLGFTNGKHQTTSYTFESILQNQEQISLNYQQLMILKGIYKFYISVTSHVYAPNGAFVGINYDPTKPHYCPLSGVCPNGQTQNEWWLTENSPAYWKIAGGALWRFSRQLYQ